MRTKVIIKLVLSIILILIIINQINFDELLLTLKSVNIFILILGFFIAFPGVAVSTLKWQILLRYQGFESTSFLKLWKLYFIGSFFSNFLPTEMGGDFVRSYEVAKESKNYTKALAAVAMERLTGLIAVVLYAFCGTLLNWSLAKEMNIQYIALILSFILLLGLIIWNNDHTSKWLDLKIKIKLILVVLDKLKSFYIFLSAYKHDKKIWLYSMIISFCNQFLSPLIVFVILIAMGINIAFTKLLLIVPIIILTGVLPITINGLGIREGAFILFFTSIGITPSASFALALLHRISTLLPGIVGGLLYGIGDLKNIKFTEINEVRDINPKRY